MHHWKHGKKGSGVYWLQQAHDEVRLNRIAQRMFDSVGKSLSDESFRVGHTVPLFAFSSVVCTKKLYYKSLSFMFCSN